MRSLLNHAAENGYGIPAFDVNNMDQIQAIMEATETTHSPVIIQASRGAQKFSGEAFLRHLIMTAAETYPHIPLVMHLDHGNAPATAAGLSLAQWMRSRRSTGRSWGMGGKR